jgi:hypothetical protein
MTKQIFCKSVPNQILFNFLENVCLKTDKYYLFDLNAYRKMIFYGYHEEFCENLKEYYHLSKQFYLERKMTYNTIATIFRQICKNKNIAFTTKIKYNESVYNINYLIYFSSSLEEI